MRIQFNPLNSTLAHVHHTKESGRIALSKFKAPTNCFESGIALLSADCSSDRQCSTRGNANRMRTNFKVSNHLNAAACLASQCNAIVCECVGPSANSSQYSLDAIRDLAINEPGTLMWCVRRVCCCLIYRSATCFENCVIFVCTCGAAKVACSCSARDTSINRLAQSFRIVNDSFVADMHGVCTHLAQFS